MDHILLKDWLKLLLLKKWQENGLLHCLKELQSLQRIKKRSFTSSEEKFERSLV